MPGWLRPEPITEEDWEECGDVSSFVLEIHTHRSCSACGMELRTATLSYDPPRPLDDCMRTSCVECDGTRRYFGRMIAADRSQLEDEDYMELMELWLGPRREWLDPYLN